MARDKRFELRCSAEELEAWGLAAGFEPVGSWARRMLNAAVSPGEVPVVGRRLGGEEMLARPFRPDFKGSERK